MTEDRALKALTLIVEWFDTPPPTTPEQDQKLAEGLQLAREVVGSLGQQIPRVGIKTSQLMYEEGWAHKPLDGLCWCYDCTYRLIDQKFPKKAS